LLAQRSSSEIEVDYSMKIIRSDEEAVSPVIGVILMVAIVVILAAIIAAFVFGMVGNVGTTKNVAVTVQQDAGKIGVITVQGGNDLNKVTHMYYAIPSASTPVPQTEVSTSNSTATPPTTYPLPVGSVVYTGPNKIDKERVIISASFDDGTSQVIYDKEF
jgi:archaeal type IV pilus assembly protein PilA